ncbi:MAG TPA: alkaline phosphatase family protein [Candidatus Saccharimonadales bacterium]|jgi:phospholipase C|nr:alkaline phosphatase family protein [Candidatus Saccharimonadales bacterium]
MILTFIPRKWRRPGAALALCFAALTSMAVPAVGQENEEAGGADRKTTSPIKHVIVIIGENRTFDNIYATYVPKHGTVTNLLSRGIIHSDGSPGPHANLARQFELQTINPVSFFIDTRKLINPGKTAYAPFLPTPEAGFAPPLAVTHSQFLKDPVNTTPPFDAKTFSTQQLHIISPELEFDDLGPITTGATGLKNCAADPTLPPVACAVPDTRVANFNKLPNTSFQITGGKLPYDSYTGDMVHRFFHMWQQSDCNVKDATRRNPTGCKNDLLPFVGVARGDDSGSNSMGFYNVQRGDAPLFKRLADEYTISDNYHQPVMGGTAVQHTMIGTADALPWEKFGDFPAQPPAAQVADPNPKSATNVAFIRDRRWTECGDLTQPGIQPIMDYLKTLPWRPDRSATNCAPGTFYMINNTRPGFLSNGQLNTAAIHAGTAVPPSSLRTIGDALNEKNISWAFYGGGFNAAARLDSGSTDPVDVLIGTGGNWYCDICNPFQYAKSIMGDPAQRKAHIKDAIDFFNEIGHGELPAVSYLKPDSFGDGHPASSKLNVLEALIDRVLDELKAHRELAEETAFIITFDEGGGYYDSGFFEPLDFFGDGPRIPLIIVSPFTRGGHVNHTYADHASIVKFIERNWRLNPLTSRSRDNLKNPVADPRNPYVPLNAPAVGDLFDMFHFDRDHDDDNR